MQKNGLMFQAFEWDLPADAQHWERLRGAAPELQEYGVDSLWLPPAHKGVSREDVGYGSYDLYDMGEFDQKNTVATKYGTIEELIALLDTLHERGMRAYADIVLNHKGGADETEIFRATPVNPEDRLSPVGESRDIEGWTKFTFPGRQGKYSAFQWHFSHFTGVDFDQRTGEKGIFRIEGEDAGFSEKVDGEKGNFDYLMNADIDVDNPDVRAELFRWGKWFFDRFPFDGMRMDAIKHIDSQFMHDFVQEMQAQVDRDLYVVGEYWTAGLETLQHYLDQVSYQLDLFDVPLHFKFFQAGQEKENFDLRTLFDDTLVASKPQQAVTFVDNHDSQPGQALESFVDDSFKIQAYALILLRQDGYPCLFYGDYYGIGGGPGREEALNPLLLARKDRAYGEQIDNFFDPNCIAFARLGDADHPHSGLVCLVSNGYAPEGYHCRMELGPDRAGQVFYDATGRQEGTLTLDDQGGAEFYVGQNSLAVWVEQEE